MKKAMIYEFGGKEYLANFTRTLNGREYQELCSADIMRPDVLYLETVDGKKKLVEDWETYYALRKKYAIDENSLNGELIVYSKKNTNAINLSEETATVEEINAKLAELFESDVKEFSEKGAKAFGHILAKHGIDNPQKWVEEKMREMADPDTLPYYCDPNSPMGSFHCKTGAISFSLDFIRKGDNSKGKFVRAHEMGHKLSADLTVVILGGEKYVVGRSGFYVYDVTLKNDSLENEVCIGTGNGHALDEGVTNLIAEKLSGIKFKQKPGYRKETFLAEQICDIVGQDTVFESALFGPQILADKWRELTKDKYSFAKIIHSLDEYRIFSRNIERSNSFKNIRKNAYKQAEHEIQKYMPFSKRVKYFIQEIFNNVSFKMSKMRFKFRFPFHKELLYVSDKINNYKLNNEDTPEITKATKLNIRRTLQNVHIEANYAIKKVATREIKKENTQYE